MKLDKRLWAALAAVLIVFHVLVFAIPFAHTAVFWIAYICMLAMFAALGYTGKRVLKKGLQLENVILGWPILRVACIATVAQLVAFFVFAALAGSCPVQAAIIVEVILLVAAFIGLLVRDTAEAVVRNAEQTLPDTTAAIKQRRAQAKALLKNNTDPALQQSLEKLSEALRYADPVSSAATAEIEVQIAEKLSNISTDADVSEILRLINQRTELCKSDKR